MTSTSTLLGNGRADGGGMSAFCIHSGVTEIVFGILGALHAVFWAMARRLDYRFARPPILRVGRPSRQPGAEQDEYEGEDSAQSQALMQQPHAEQRRHRGIDVGDHG